MIVYFIINICVVDLYLSSLFKIFHFLISNIPTKIENNEAERNKKKKRCYIKVENDRNKRYVCRFRNKNQQKKMSTHVYAYDARLGGPRFRHEGSPACVVFTRASHSEISADRRGCVPKTRDPLPPVVRISHHRLCRRRRSGRSAIQIHSHRSTGR